METQTSPKNATTEQRACAYCDEPFTPRRSDQKCCSADHRKLYEQQKRQRAKQRQPHSLTCNWCTGSFESTRIDAEYCSTECQQAFNNFWKGWGPRFGKALTAWRVKKAKGAFTALCRLFSAARQEAKDKREEAKR